MIYVRGSILIKILHTADVHLDSPLRSLALRNSDLRDAVAAASRSAFRGLVDFAISDPRRLNRDEVPVLAAAMTLA